MTELSDETTSKLIIAKVTSMLTLGLLTFLIGSLPLKLSKYINLNTQNSQSNNFCISLLLCFGGGVLLFTTFIHLQPEVRESFEKLQKTNQIPNFDVPIAELIFCSGFFFVYLIEEIVHMCLEKFNDGEHYHQEDEALQRSISLRRCSKINSEIISSKSISTITTLPENEIKCNGHAHGNHSHTNIQKTDDLKSSFHCLLTVLALSFHAVFEGLAVGLENSTARVLYLFAAIATHKLVISFCVGIELLNSKIKLPMFLSCIATFAVVTPLGIGIGILLSATGGSDGSESLIAVILQGMAAGTLLYVVFFEVLAREKNNDHEGIWQLIAIILGFMIMFVAQYTTGHQHSHEHEEDEHPVTEKLATVLNDISQTVH